MSLGIAQTRRKCHSFLDTLIQIQEAYLEFVECEQGTTGEQVATLIQSTCQTLGPDKVMTEQTWLEFVREQLVLFALNFQKALYFHCASHKLNPCVARSCKLTSVMNMMDAITCLANVFNYLHKGKRDWKIMSGSIQRH